MEYWTIITKYTTAVQAEFPGGDRQGHDKVEAMLLAQRVRDLGGEAHVEEQPDGSGVEESAADGPAESAPEDYFAGMSAEDYRKATKALAPRGWDHA